MADPERLSLEPEVCLARRLVDRRSLSPRIDVEALLRGYADLHFADLPGVDGACLNLKVPGKRPTVFVDIRAPKRRQRFTMAHELGHVLIPWHVGTIFDEIEPQLGENVQYARMEAQANRFAAELLMPEQWCRTLALAHEDVGLLHQAITNDADVSPEAAAYRTLLYGSSGWIMASIDDERVLFGGRTRGTYSNAPNRGDSSTKLLRARHFKFTSVSFGTNRFVWGREQDVVQAPPVPSEDWRVVLDRMSLTLPLEERHKAKQRLNAVVGGANSRIDASRDAGSIFARVLQRVEGREFDSQLTPLISHPDFSAYLAGRVHDMAR